jgi:hypothetical protein
MICFNGPFSHSVIEELGIAVRKYLESNEAPRDRVADVFAVFVEQAQNLKNYTSNEIFASPELVNYRNGTLVISREKNGYIVSSGNLVQPKDGEMLTHLLDELVGLDSTALKVLYKQRLRSNPSSGPGGAGLGFIDMARKASEPVRYSLRTLDDGAVFFNISVTI